MADEVQATSEEQALKHVIIELSTNETIMAEVVKWGGSNGRFLTVKSPLSLNMGDDEHRTISFGIPISYRSVEEENKLVSYSWANIVSVIPPRLDLVSVYSKISDSTEENILAETGKEEKSVGPKLVAKKKTRRKNKK